MYVRCVCVHKYGGKFGGMPFLLPWGIYDWGIYIRSIKKNASYLHSNDFLTELKILRNYNKAKIKSYFSENIFIIFSDASHIGCN